MPVTNEPVTKRDTRFRAACATVWEMTWQPILNEHIVYVAYGVETCPTTGRQHLQLFAYSAQAMRFSAWIKYFPQGTHVEKMNGTFRDNHAYCSKEGKYTELGVRPMCNGKRRTDLIVKQAIDSDPTKSLSQIYDETTETAALLYDRAFEKYRLYKRRRTIPLNEPVEVIYIYGLPGCGKTRYVFDTEPDVYEVPFGMQWFDGYEGQEAVLFDNLSPTDIKNKSFFLRLIDRYRVQVPIKGGYTFWKPKRIYITTVNAVDRFTEIFDDAQEFLRRITVYKNDLSIE